MPVGRYGHWMVTLHDGRVMIIGAGDPSSLRKNVLIYDSSTNTFTAGPDTIYSVLQIYVLHIAVRIGKLRPGQSSLFIHGQICQKQMNLFKRPTS